MPPSLLVQQIPIPGAQLICRGGTGVLYVLAGRQIYRVQSMPADRQIKMLLDEKQFQLAVKLCVSIHTIEMSRLCVTREHFQLSFSVQNISESPENEKIKQRKEIQTLYAYDLFRNKQYQESMEQFLELDIGNEVGRSKNFLFLMMNRKNSQLFALVRRSVRRDTIVS